MKTNNTAMFLTLLGLLANNGCKLGPDYERPKVETPEFKEAGPWKPIEPSDQIPRGKWWEIYGDPVLNELQNKMEVSSPTLKIAEAKMRQAQASAAVLNSARYPKLGAEAGVGRNKSSSQASSAGKTSSTAEVGLSASWELDLWGQVRRNVELGRAQAEAGAAELESAKLSCHAMLAQTYFSLRVLDGEVRIYKSIIEGLERAYKIALQRHTQGIDSLADVAAAEAQLKTSQAQAVGVELQRRQLEHGLAVLVGEAPAAFSLQPTEMKLNLPKMPELIASQQLEQRPDIAATERRLAAASAGIGVAEGGYYPVFNLTASGGFQGSSLAHLFTAPHQVWALGLGSVAPLFNGGKVKAQVAQAQAVYDECLAAYRQSVLVAFQEVEDHLAAVSALAQEYELQTAALNAARRSADMALNQYKAGLVSYLNVVSSQTTLLSAEKAAILVYGRQLNASVVLLKAVGASPYQEGDNI